MKRILLISAFPPNNKTAGQNFTLQLVNQLNGKYLVDLIYFGYKDHETQVPDNGSIKIIESYRLNKINKIINACKIPLLHPYFTNRLKFRLIYFLLKNRDRYDLLYFDFSQVFLYSIFVSKRNTILMSHDVISQLYSRKEGAFNRIMTRICHYSEGFILRLSKSYILCFSNKDKNLLQSKYKINATKVDFFINSLIKNIDLNLIELNNCFCFFGAWNREENIEGLEWFISQVLHLLRHDCKFIVIGGGMSSALKEKIQSIPGFILTGFVENPYRIVSACNALVAPLFKGSGVKVKVIESLACGTPVIGTSVALEGIDIFDKSVLLQCNSAKDFADVLNTYMPVSISKKEYTRNLFNEQYHQETVLSIVGKLI